MTVRTKAILAYVAAAALLVAALKHLSRIGAPSFAFLIAVLAVGAVFVAYARSLRCPNCHRPAFSTRWLALLYVPRTCASCDRDLADV